MTDKRGGATNSSSCSSSSVTNSSSHSNNSNKEERKEKNIDDIYRYDEEHIAVMRKERPWEKESTHTSTNNTDRQTYSPRVLLISGLPPLSVFFLLCWYVSSIFSVKHFKNCRVSALAAMKMVTNRDSQERQGGQRHHQYYQISIACLLRCVSLSTCLSALLLFL